LPASTLDFHLPRPVRWRVSLLRTDLGFPAPPYAWKTAVIPSELSGQWGAETKSHQLFLPTGLSRSLWKEDVIQ